MLKMNPTPTSSMQKLMNLVDEFAGGDYDENEVRRTSALMKRPAGADYPSSNHVSYTVNNFVSNSAQKVSNYPTLDAKRAFDQLRQAFTEAPILQYFDSERYIRVETDASGHAIGGVLSQLIHRSGQWHLVPYLLRKIIPAKTQYETHDGELLAIVETFKT